MAPFLSQSQNKSRSIGSSIASISSTSPEVIAFICSSVLIFLVFLGSAIILIHRRLRHRTQSATRAEAQVQYPDPLASESKEKVNNVFSPTSSSSKSLGVEYLLPHIGTLRPASTAVTKDFVEKLVSKAPAALSHNDKYTTLPLRRSRHARQSKIEEKNPIFDLSMSLAALDAEIVNLETARRHSRWLFSARSVSLTSGTAISSPTNASTPLESQMYSIATPSGPADQSPIRPSPTIVSMEARPLETDAAALPDSGTMFVSGSIPSFSSISSAISLSTACEAVVVGHTTAEAEEIGKLSADLERKTPRQREHGARVEKRTPGTPSSSSTSVSAILTVHDTTFSSDADSVSEVGSCEAPVNNKLFKLGDVLSLPISVFDFGFDLSSGKGDGVIGLHPSLSSDVLHSNDTKSEHGNLTPFVSADTSF